MRVPRQARDLNRRHYGAIGLAVMAISAIALYISVISINGLPFESVYRVSVEVPNANRLVKTNEVRVRGVRVGMVERLKAMPSRGDGAVFSRVTLKLDSDVKPLPIDTRVAVRPVSVLGATYLDLEIGHAEKTIPDGGTLPLGHAQSTVELTDLLDVFDKSTAKAAQAAFTGPAIALTGRGQDINTALPTIRRLLPSISRAAGTLADPGTRLGPFVDAFGRLAAQLQPEAASLAKLVAGGASTFGALADEHAAVGATIDALAPTERAVSAALERLDPQLRDLAKLAENLRPAGRVIRPALHAVSRAAAAGVRPAKRVPAFARALSTSLTVLRRVTGKQSTTRGLLRVGDAVQALGTTLEVLTPAQAHCNLVSLFFQNFAMAGKPGAGAGPAFANVVVKSLGADGDVFQNSRPSRNVHINYLPNENADECESGNEPYDPSKQLLINPPGQQSTATRTTVPPPGVRARAAAAGLLDEGRGR
jgi:virulence factor Mce-like protein